MSSTTDPGIPEGLCHRVDEDGTVCGQPFRTDMDDWIHDGCTRCWNYKELCETKNCHAFKRATDLIPSKPAPVGEVPDRPQRTQPPLGEPSFTPEPGEIVKIAPGIRHVEDGFDLVGSELVAAIEALGVKVTVDISTCSTVFLMLGDPNKNGSYRAVVGYGCSSTTGETYFDAEQTQVFSHYVDYPQELRCYDECREEEGGLTDEDEPSITEMAEAIVSFYNDHPETKYGYSDKTWRYSDEPTSAGQTREDWEDLIVDHDQGTLDEEDIELPFAPAVVDAWIASGYLVPTDG